MYRNLNKIIKKKVCYSCETKIIGHFLGGSLYNILITTFMKKI